MCGVTHSVRSTRRWVTRPDFFSAIDTLLDHCVLRTEVNPARAVTSWNSGVIASARPAMITVG
jgi:hypothetical protein